MAKEDIGAAHTENAALFLAGKATNDAAALHTIVEGIPCKISEDGIRPMYGVMNAAMAARKSPPYPSGKARFSDIESFAAHVSRFKSDSSALFLNELGLVTAVYNYHSNWEHGGWCDHRAELCIPETTEAKAWAGNQNQWIHQERFAQFVDEHQEDVEESGGVSGAILASAANDVGFSAGAKYSRKRDKNGQGVTLIEKSEDVSTHVPTRFQIAIPILEGLPKNLIDVRLLVSIKDERPYFKYVLQRWSEHVSKAQRQVGALVKEATDRPILYGHPEPLPSRDTGRVAE